MFEQSVLIQDVVALTCGTEDFVNLAGNVNDYFWHLVTKQQYLTLTHKGYCGINAYDCYWIGAKEVLNETQSVYEYQKDCGGIT